LKKRDKILISIGVLIVGWFLSGFAFTTKFGHPISTICLIMGVVMFIFGIIFLIINLNRE